MFRPLSVKTALILAMALAPAAAAATFFPRLTDIRPLALHDGANPEPRMDSARDGLIIQAQREYFSADGAHKTFMVLLRSATPDRGWSLTPLGGEETFSNIPHTGEDTVRSVRFARAKIDGRPVFIVMAAQRAMEGSIPANSHVTLTLYRLQPVSDAGPVFVRLGERVSTACYGDADLALKMEFGVPLPPGYAGPSTAGPCGQD